MSTYFPTPVYAVKHPDTCKVVLIRTKITRLFFIELHHDSTLTNLLLFNYKGKKSHLSIIGDGMYNTPFPHLHCTIYLI